MALLRHQRYGSDGKGSISSPLHSEFPTILNIMLAEEYFC